MTGASGRINAEISLAVDVVEVWVGARIDAVAVDPGQLAILFGQPPTPFYYVELYAGMPFPPYVAVSYFDGAGYTFINRMQLGSLPTGRVALRMVAQTTPLQITSDLRNAGGILGTATASAPGYAGATAFQVTDDGIQLELEYIAIVAPR